MFCCKERAFCCGKEGGRARGDMRHRSVRVLPSLFSLKHAVGVVVFDSFVPRDRGGVASRAANKAKRAM